MKALYRKVYSVLSTISHMDSNSPRKDRIFPMSRLSGMLVIKARRAGSMLPSSAPIKVAMITNHHIEGPVMQAKTMFQRAIDTNPNVATV